MAGNTALDEGAPLVRHTKSARGLAQSKTRWSIAGVWILFSTSFAGTAQPFAIDWFTIDGGGGASAGRVYSLRGTIGQPDANAQPMTGGNFSVTGGFWSLFAVQTPGAALLTITLNPQLSTITISWPSPSIGFTLQQNSDLNTTNWTAAPQVVGDDGTNKFITVSPPIGDRFYRLFKP
jgi:hypothetical protein